MPFLIDWWWLVVFIYSWFMLFLLSGPRRVRSFYAMGAWSVLIAASMELIIRIHFHFWIPAATATTIWGVEMLLLAGPRFVEGTLFAQAIPKQTSWQLPAVVIWSLLVTLVELTAVLSGKAEFSLHNMLLAFMLHLLRFTTLFALYCGLTYERRAERLGVIYRQERRRRLSQSFWKVSFIPIYFSMRLLVEKMAKK